jgi:hypothetical protein
MDPLQIRPTSSGDRVDRQTQRLRQPRGFDGGNLVRIVEVGIIVGFRHALPNRRRHCLGNFEINGKEFRVFVEASQMPAHGHGSIVVPASEIFNGLPIIASNSPKSRPNAS